MDNPVANHIDPAAAMTSDGIPTHNQAPNATTDHNSSPVAINPVHDVFNTFELCENILSYISTYDLSRAKRVSRHYGEVIERSPRLQRNLFQKPSYEYHTFGHPDHQSPRNYQTESCAVPRAEHWK
jgi:hypothetical protein